MGISLSFIIAIGVSNQQNYASSYNCQN